MNSWIQNNLSLSRSFYFSQKYHWKCANKLIVARVCVCAPACVCVCPHIRYKRRKENCLTRKSYTQHVFRVGKKVITYRHLWRENWTELIVSHCTGLCFCSQEKEKRRRKKKILWAFYCRIGSEETAGARLFFFFFSSLSPSLFLFRCGPLSLQHFRERRERKTEVVVGEREGLCNQ